MLGIFPKPLQTLYVDRKQREFASRIAGPTDDLLLAPADMYQPANEVIVPSASDRRGSSSRRTSQAGPTVVAYRRPSVVEPSITDSPATQEDEAQEDEAQEHEQLNPTLAEFAANEFFAQFETMVDQTHYERLGKLHAQFAVYDVSNIKDVVSLIELCLKELESHRSLFLSGFHQTVSEHRREHSDFKAQVRVSQEKHRSGIQDLTSQFFTETSTSLEEKTSQMKQSIVEQQEMVDSIRKEVEAKADRMEMLHKLGLKIDRAEMLGAVAKMQSDAQAMQELAGEMQHVPVLKQRLSDALTTIETLSDRVAALQGAQVRDQNDLQAVLKKSRELEDTLATREQATSTLETRMKKLEELLQAAGERERLASTAQANLSSAVAGLQKQDGLATLQTSVQELQRDQKALAKHLEERMAASSVSEELESLRSRIRTLTLRQDELADDVQQVAGTTDSHKDYTEKYCTEFCQKYCETLNFNMRQQVEALDKQMHDLFPGQLGVTSSPLPTLDLDLTELRARRERRESGPGTREIRRKSLERNEREEPQSRRESRRTSQVLEREAVEEQPGDQQALHPARPLAGVDDGSTDASRTAPLRSVRPGSTRSLQNQQSQQFSATSGTAFGRAASATRSRMSASAEQTREHLRGGDALIGAPVGMAYPDSGRFPGARIGKGGGFVSSETKKRPQNTWMGENAE